MGPRLDPDAGTLAQTALLVALLAVSAQLTVAVGPVPFTLQTLAVGLVVLTLGPVRAACTVGAYVALGALGLPVFSAMRGGLAMVAGPTGGYIYGFVFAAFAGSLLRVALCPPAARRGYRIRSAVADAAGLACSLAVCYAVGTAHFMAVGAVQGSSQGLAAVLGVCVLPFVVPDALKCVAAFAVAAALRRAVPSVAAQ